MSAGTERQQARDRDGGAWSLVARSAEARAQSGLALARERGREDEEEGAGEREEDGERVVALFRREGARISERRRKRKRAVR